MLEVVFESSGRLADAVTRMSDYVKGETLATQLHLGRDGAEHWQKWEIDGEPCEIGISKA